MSDDFNLNSNIICSYNNFKILISDKPLGGYESEVGTITIEGTTRKFQELTCDDCVDLAIITNTVLKIFEENNIQNSLIFGRHTLKNEGHPIFSIVPYKSCGLWRKIQVGLQVIFGYPQLKENQMIETLNFYRGQSSTEKLSLENRIQEQKEQFEKGLYSTSQYTSISPKADVFCNADILNKQRVTSYSLDDYSVLEILVDNLPKVPDPIHDIHLLSLFSGYKGHVDGSFVPIVQRARLFFLNASIANRILSKNHDEDTNQSKFKEMILLERNGKKLRGVDHQHFHLEFIQKFPKTLIEKIRICVVLPFKMLFRISLSDKEISDNIQTVKNLIEPQLSHL